MSETIKLNIGTKIPQLGLGVAGTPAGDVTVKAVRSALEEGYRHIDTASIYRNEQSVGLTIRQSNVPRSEIYITTKIWNRDQGYESTLQACSKSLQKLDLDYIDLYLIHWPVEGFSQDTWLAMERLLEEGRCRAIGVSNYTAHHLRSLLAHTTRVPAVNQFELSPYNYGSRRDMIELCRSKGIAVVAYSPLTKGTRLADPKLMAIAAQYDKTPAQVLIRWGIQHDFIEIPKSVRPERIRENADVFDFTISDSDMEQLNGFDENLATSSDPAITP